MEELMNGDTFSVKIVVQVDCNLEWAMYAGRTTKTDMEVLSSGMKLREREALQVASSLVQFDDLDGYKYRR